MPSKFEFNKGKMVPYPSGAIVPDRDLGQRPALECIHLGIEFGGLKAVDDFSLTIGKTEIAGLIGPNGAGKTTVFNLLTKVYQPTHGTILLDGEDTSGKSVYQVNRMGIARTFQNIRLFNTMTVEDNVKVGLHNQERYSGFEACCACRRIGSTRRPPTSAPWSCCPFLTWSTWQMNRPARFLTAPSVVWRSFARLPPTPNCCCSTSLPPA